MLNQMSGLQSHSSMKTHQRKYMQLYLLGKNEVFGMEEIVDQSAVRGFTVTCSSTTAACYVMSRGDFQDCVNNFRFGDQVI
jgi:hypothetical protein